MTSLYSYEFIGKFAICFEFQDNGNLLAKKGDFFFASDHLIELVSRLYTVVTQANTQPPDVTIRSK